MRRQLKSKAGLSGFLHVMEICAGTFVRSQHRDVEPALGVRHTDVPGPFMGPCVAHASVNHPRRFRYSLLIHAGRGW